MFISKEGEIERFLRKTLIRTGVAPDAVAGVAQRNSSNWELFGGSGQGGSLDQPFDLASITKSFSALLTSVMVKKGFLSWHTPLQEVLHELIGSPGGSQTIEALISHRASLVPHMEFFRESWNGRPICLRRLIINAGNGARIPMSTKPLYSDLGYLLVGFALERAGHKALDRLFAEHLFIPRGLRVGSARAWIGERSAFRNEAAPTEIQVPRGGLLRGVVHDDNAWALAGAGSCAHAGLFAPLSAILKFGCQLLDSVNGRFGPSRQAQVERLIRRRPGGNLRMGFDGISRQGTTLAGKLAGLDSFGHLGFTGTSLWCDPEADKVTVLLSNRVYPTRANPGLQALRPIIHDFLWSY